jgi:hypothetical protein
MAGAMGTTTVMITTSSLILPVYLPTVRAYTPLLVLALTSLPCSPYYSNKTNYYEGWHLLSMLSQIRQSLGKTGDFGVG